ncbi:hypothetical protein GCM10022243_09990 [Saccharothrix violaceirubra]|uniref:Uncharacterized protein n=1 Tax=Saccharothrix violaceirubra TaxID=413306 RepID=A0A7W7T405_9PSEU|nr:hypothetical protein [Saccharothrix violaceirubra]
MTTDEPTPRFESGEDTTGQMREESDGLPENQLRWIAEFLAKLEKTRFFDEAKARDIRTMLE